jgi:exopolysaccharide biosynthesis polyprenyl glycosylphosphotransferase
MSHRENQANLTSSLAALALDALTVYGALALAVWIRFDSGWLAVDPLKGRPTAAHQHQLMLVGTGVLLATFYALGLYQRPHQGRFEDKIPRLARATGLGFILYLALERVLNLDPPFSRLALGVGFGTVLFAILLQRYLAFRAEWNLARHLPRINHVLIVGTDALAARLAAAIQREPFLRSRVYGFLSTGETAAVPAEQIRGALADLPRLVREGVVTRVIVADVRLPQDDLLEMTALCENHFVQFSLVPDLFRILTSGLEITNLGGIPVLGVQKWPLDYFSRRASKRAADILLSSLGLMVAGPVILLAGLAVKLTSPGPMFFRQKRLGENGREFHLFKIRSMRHDPEAESRPGWTVENDPRRTRLGAWLRRLNIDELPQLWNVLKGDMSLVGPRPEQPFYVERFREEFDRYMRRHVYKPGITGWAQVNGLRGDTSIEERLKADLYYLENWSLSLDLKILLKTFFSHRNAY